jgi:predicted ATPase with chaperone activity
LPQTGSGPCPSSSPPASAAKGRDREQQRISGPLLDRIDIHVEVPRIDYEKLSDLQALYELGYADDYRLHPKELAET